MKICDACGCRNWTVTTNRKGEPVCLQCKKKLPGYAACYPEMGDHLEAGYRINPHPLSDEVAR